MTDVLSPEIRAEADAVIRELRYSPDYQFTKTVGGYRFCLTFMRVGSLSRVTILDGKEDEVSGTIAEMFWGAFL